MTGEQIEIISEIMIRIDWNIERVVAAACLTALCRGCMESVSAKVQKWASFLTGGIYFLVYMGLYWLPDWSGYSVNMIALLAAFLVFIRIEPKRVRTKIYCFSVFLVVCWMVGSVANRIGYFFAIQADKGIYYLAGPQNPALQKYYLLSFGGYLLTELFCYGFLLFGVMRVVRKTCEKKEQDMEGQEFLILMIPVVNGMAAHSILHFYNNIYEEKTGFSLFDTYQKIEYLWLFYYAVIIASIISTAYLYQKISERQEEENARMLLEGQVKDIRSHITEVEKLYTDIRGVKHDIRNHVEVINSLLAVGKTQEAREYSYSLAETVEAFDFAVKTGNPVTDVIIHEKMGLAREQGINFLCDFHYPVDMGINAFDVSVILSNALSNAIEAAKGKGMIKVSSFKNKNAYLITVENSFEEDFKTEEGGLPKTSKTDTKSHGFGLQNIRSAAAKYYGDVQIEQKGKAVVLTVMLMAG